MRRKRQVDVIEGGGTIVQETRLFDPDKGETRSLRSKEDAHDYRYFPDPDLLPLELDEAFLDECRASLPELPDAKRQRYESARPPALQCRRADRRRRRPRAGSRRCSTAEVEPEGGRQLGDLGPVRRPQPARQDDRRQPGQPRPGRELLALVADGTLSGTLAKQVFEIMLETGEDPARDRRGSAASSRPRDTGAIEAAIAEVIAANADKVARVSRRQGRAVRLLRRPDDEGDGGQGQPAVVNELLRAKLDG